MKPQGINKGLKGYHKDPKRILTCESYGIKKNSKENQWKPEGKSKQTSTNQRELARGAQGIKKLL